MMKKAAITLFLPLLLGSVSALAAGTKVPPAPNGIPFPADYLNWKTIAVSHRTDNKTLRNILGNPVAIKAARAGKTNPWPDGTILGKVVWKDKTDENWPAATVPAHFVHAEFMVKDSKKFASTGGWGYARWKGANLMPYGADAQFSQECVACHTPVKSRDYVFTTPAIMPTR